MTKKKKDNEEGAEFGFKGIFKGLSNLVEKLGEMAEMGQEFSKRGEINFPNQEKLKGVYGFSVKMGLGGEGVKVEPFGNIRSNETCGEPVVQEIREPMVDVLAEKDYVLVVAETPGISAEDVKVDIKDDVLSIFAQRGDKKYRKEVLLPQSFSREKISVSCNNGILEIKCTK